MLYNSERYRITYCKDCPDRYPGCHGSCEKYIEQRAAYDAEKAEAMKKIEVSRGLAEMRCDFMYKVSRRNNYRSKYRKG